MLLSPINYQLVILLASIALTAMPQSVGGQNQDAAQTSKPLQEVKQLDTQKIGRSTQDLSIDELIELLGSPDFVARRDATRALNKRNSEVFSSLRSAYHQADDMEVRLRIEGIVHKIFYRQSLRTNVGWLGIRMLQNTRRIRKIGTPLPAGHVGIHLAEVTQDGPAQMAGMAVSDIIIEIDNEPLKGNTAAAFEVLRETVQRAGPGEELSFTVLRDQKKLSIHVVLGHATPQILRSPTYGTKYGEAVGIANERFPIWWRQFTDSPDRPMIYKIERLTTDLDFENKP